MAILLQIWAVIGPILVASASAIWLRRAQLQDRDHEAQQRKEARAEALEDEERVFRRNISETDRAQLRIMSGEFLYRAGEFVDSHIQLCLREPPQGIQDRCEESREQFNKISHQLALTAPEQLSKATVVMQNCTAEFLVIHKSNDENKLNELGERYKAAKANFMTEAKKVLGAQLIEA